MCGPVVHLLAVLPLLSSEQELSAERYSISVASLVSMGLLLSLFSRLLCHVPAWHGRLLRVPESFLPKV